MTQPSDVAANNTGQLPRPAYDATVESLNALADAPIAVHPEVFDTVHTDLREALRQIDDI